MQRDKLTFDPMYFETYQLHHILTLTIILTNTNPFQQHHKNKSICPVAYKKARRCSSRI